MFFSEEKNQKTYASKLAARYGTWPEREASQDIRVFWFYSSEKNMLPSFAGIL
jgi:hypothetical protein